MDTTIPEVFVQNQVAELINKIHYKRKKVHISTEEHTKDYNRVDVFLAFPFKNKKVYVVAIEAKSKTTLGQLRLNDSEEKRIGISRWVIGILFFAFISFLFKNQVRQVLDSPTALLIAVTIIIGIILFAQLLKKLNFKFTKSIPVIEQLKKYHANEKWIAVSTEAIEKDSDYRILRKETQKRGIGLIIVDENGDLSISHNPKAFYERVKQDFLSYYLRETDLRKELGPINFYKKTPAQAIATTNSIITWGWLIFMILLFLFLVLANESKLPFQ